MTKKKNGKIEFLRFVFCIYVFLFHFYKYGMGELNFKETGIKLWVFPHGSMGVEFFFFLSGLLMAASVYKRIHMPNAIESGRKWSKDYVGFITRKIMAFFPYHIVAFVIVLLAYLIPYLGNWSKVISTVITSVPCFFLLNMTGLKMANPNNIEWYLSAMIICMAIIYPVCRKYYYRFSRYWAPLIGILLMGYIVGQTGCVTGVEVEMGPVKKGLIRAFAEICIGVFAFELCRFIDSLNLNKKARMLLTAIEIATFIFVSLMVVLTLGKKYEIFCLAATFVLVVLSFSSSTYGRKLFDNKFVYFLGSISLPVYLSQAAGSRLITTVFNDYGTTEKFLIYTGVTIVTSVIVKLIGKQIAKMRFVKNLLEKTSA
ncbi:MAG: acyltransferase [Clostridiales bacterium]|nr:acyltransferase [Clostridiales bacterium]